MCSVYHKSRDLSSVFNVLRVIQQALNIAVQSQDQPSRAPQDSGAYSCPDRLITEQHVKGFKREGVRAFKRLPGQLITPLARDTLKAFGITLEE